MDTRTALHQAFDRCLDPKVLDDLLRKSDVLALVPAWKHQAGRYRNESVARAWCLFINRRTDGTSRKNKADLCSLLGRDALLIVSQTSRFHQDATKRFALCPGCKELPRQFRLACGHCTCACTSPNCPTCNFSFDQEDAQSISHDPRTATGATVVSQEQRMEAGGPELVAFTDCPSRLLSESNRVVVIENLRNAIVILENLPHTQLDTCTTISGFALLGKAAPSHDPAHPPLPTQEMPSDSFLHVCASAIDVIADQEPRSQGTVATVASPEEAEILHEPVSAPACSYHSKFDSVASDPATSLAQFQENLQKVCNLTSPGATPKWSFEGSADHGWVAILSCPFLSSDVRSPEPAKNKRDAKRLVAQTALPHLRSRLAEIEFHCDSCDSGRLLKDLQERYQHRFQKSPTWLPVEVDPNNKGVFRAGFEHRGEPVRGKWAPSKQAAKADALKGFLDSADTPNIGGPSRTSTQGLADTSCSQGLSLPGLQEKYQQRFQKSPDWRPYEVDPNNVQMFRASFEHRGNVITGDWSLGKTGAKADALKKYLALNSTCCGSPSQTSSQGSTPGLAAATSPSSSTHSLSTLQEKYQRRFQKSPDWIPDEVDPNNVQMFRASFEHQSAVISGEWSLGKKAAKADALRKLLEPNDTSCTGSLRE